MKKTLLLFAGILQLSINGFSYSIKSTDKKINLAPSLEILEGQYSFEQIISGKYDSLFTKNNIQNKDEKNRDRYCWARIKVKSDASQITSWILQTDKLYGDVNCYIVYPDGKIITQTSGWNLPPVNRSVVDPDVIFNLSLDPQQSAVIYLQIHTNLRWSTLSDVKAKLYSADEWTTAKWKKYSFLLFYTGVCLLAMFYWLITYLYSSRVNYIYLILATLAGLIFYLDNFGVTTSLFWNDTPWYFFSKYGQNFLWLPFVGISWFLMGTRLNHLDRNVPRLYNLILLMIVLATLFSILSPAFFCWSISKRMSLLAFLSTSWILLLSLLYWGLKENKKTALFAFNVSLAMGGGITCFVLSSLEILPDKLLINMIGPFGALISMILFFYGMVNYVRALRHKREEELIEKEKLIQEQNTLLEQKVEERTHQLEERGHELESEKKKTDELLKKSDDLLLNILPAEIAEEIKQQGRSKAKTYGMVSVMFTDFKGFTTVSEKVSPELLVAEIDYCFSAFDNIVQKHGVEKIKTVGDAYICVGGMPVLTFTHATDTINAAIEIRDFMLQRKKEKEERGEIPFELRIGIHTGPVVAGIVGVKKYAYDIWGATVNFAARMEQNSDAGKINISGSTYELVKTKFKCEHRGKIQAKNKGEIDMYFVEGN
ncbi:MAG: adenylate/guanylate cyclase domain-containing protein [Bacteroidia bacterium]